MQSVLIGLLGQITLEVQQIYYLYFMQKFCLVFLKILKKNEINILFLVIDFALVYFTDF